MTNWLEISLAVDGELAEAVADVLARYAPNSVVTEQGIIYINDEYRGTPGGPITVRAYLEIDEQIENTRQKVEEALFYLGMIQPIPTPVYRQVADQNWMEAWKQHYRPIPVGNWLIILPVWLDTPQPDRIPIKIDPGMAFGTGTHPTTQLSLELIELAAADRPLCTVIDIGCGSGILSIAALKLGAQAALGVDVDIESVRNARENAGMNDIGDEFVIGQASVAEVLAGKFSIKQAPLVVANILAPVLVRLLGAGLADLAESGGRMILSGILAGQEGDVLDAARAKGLVLDVCKEMGDWVGLSLLKPEKTR